MKKGLLSLIVILFSINCFAFKFIVVNTNDAGVGSLRQCITDANANPGLDTIYFNIPGSTLHTINLTGPYDVISDSIYINGLSEPGSSASNLLIQLDGGNNMNYAMAIYSSDIHIQGLIYKHHSFAITMVSNEINVHSFSDIRISNCIFQYNNNALNLTSTDTIGLLKVKTNIFDRTGTNVYLGCSGVYSDVDISGNLATDSIGQSAVIMQMGPSPASVLNNLSVSNNSFSNYSNPITLGIGGVNHNVFTINKVRIDSNNISNMTAVGISVFCNSSGGTNTSMSGINIQNNSINNACSGRGIWIHLTSSNGARESIDTFNITNNTISLAGTNSGIELLEDGNAGIRYFNLQNFTIKSNSVSNTTNGIYLFSAGNGSMHTFIQNFAIAKNTIFQNQFNGIDLETLGTNGINEHIGNSTIDSNYIYNNGQNGIYFGANRLNASSCNIRYQRVRNNSIYQNGQFGICAINFDTQASMGGLLFSRNSIHDNDSTGIHLKDNSFNYANPIIPAPVLDSVYYLSGNFVIVGHIQSLPLTQYTVEFFSNTTADPSGYGEGETYLLTATVITDSSGYVSFSNPTNINIGGKYISSTSTDLLLRNTSEFSNVPALAFVGINENNFNSSFSIYPNPVKDLLVIKTGTINTGKLINVEIRDVCGKVVITTTMNQLEQSISVGFLSSGMYTCLLREGNNQSVSKFVKE